LKLKQTLKSPAGGSIPASPKYLQNVFKPKMIKGQSSYTQEQKNIL
jgi:hypothetical protein